MPRACVTEPDRDVVAERRAEERADADVVAARGRGQREADGRVAAPPSSAASRWARRRPQAPRECGVRSRCASRRLSRSPAEAERGSRTWFPTGRCPRAARWASRPTQVLRAVRDGDELVEVFGEHVVGGAPRTTPRLAGPASASSGNRPRTARGRGSRRGTSPRPRRDPGCARAMRLRAAARPALAARRGRARAVRARAAVPR